MEENKGDQSSLAQAGEGSPTVNCRDFFRLLNAVNTPKDVGVFVDYQGNCCPIVGVRLSGEVGNGGEPHLMLLIEAVEP